LTLRFVAAAKRARVAAALVLTHKFERKPFSACQKVLVMFL
jgi:hypothetical protein